MADRSKMPKVCVLRAPGTNCDVETAFAFEQCGAAAERVHVFRLLERPDLLADYQVLCIPGGFSYGDDIGAGVIFSRQLRGRLGDAIGTFLQRDKLVLGICNGFQVLLKAGILPEGAQGWPPNADDQPPATLTWNENGKYTALWVTLRILNQNNVFLRGIAEIELPIAHAEGRLVVRDQEVLDSWRAAGQAAACYAPHNGANGTLKPAQTGAERLFNRLPYPDNPNGSDANLAALGDPTGRVLGLMPHPERYLFATQHPQWTRRNLSGEGAGMQLFRNAVAYFA
jgi:phosphoribosylformylglycinamidine synthase